VLELKQSHPRITPVRRSQPEAVQHIRKRRIAFSFPWPCVEPAQPSRAWRCVTRSRRAHWCRARLTFVSAPPDLSLGSAPRRRTAGEAAQERARAW